VNRLTVVFACAGNEVACDVSDLPLVGLLFLNHISIAARRLRFVRHSAFAVPKRHDRRFAMVETIRSRETAPGGIPRRERVRAIAYEPQEEANGSGRRERDRRAEAAYFAGVASTPFVAQLAALYFGDAAAAERRVARDPSQVRTRADAAYRSVGRLTSAIEAGFMGEVTY
jgi:hypothetical protein